MLTEVSGAFPAKDAELNVMALDVGSDRRRSITTANVRRRQRDVTTKLVPSRVGARATHTVSALQECSDEGWRIGPQLRGIEVA